MDSMMCRRKKFYIHILIAIFGVTYCFSSPDSREKSQVSSTGLAMPFGNVLMIDSENIEASTRRYERNGDDLTGRSFSKTGDENIKERNEQPVLTNLESEKGYSSGSVLFRPNKNPYPTAKSPSVSQIFWGEVKTKSIKAPFKMDDLDSKECLVRVTVQDKPNKVT